MATSTQRLIMMIVFISLLSSSVPMFTGQAEYSLAGLVNESGVYEDHLSDYANDDIYSSSKNKDYLTETTVGNSLSMTAVVWSIFSSAFNPFSITPNDFNDDLGKLVALFLVFMKLMLGVLVALELYNILKNKKVS